MSDQFSDVLAARYASARMQELWSPKRRIVLERRLWIAILEAQCELGLAVDASVVDDYKAVVEQVDLESIAVREAVSRHDVKARIDEFCALAGHEQIHLGMTSRDVTENTEQLQIREALEVIRDDLVAVIARLAELAEHHIHTTMVARTHNVAAQATTLGKRFADSAAETMLGLERVNELIDRYPLRGIKGPVGTRVDQLNLLGSVDAVDQLEQRVAKYLGFNRVLTTSAQVYPRSLDLDVVAALAQAVAGPSSLAVTLRLMAGHGLVAEGFRSGQVGSSAMPHKANMRSSERVAALGAALSGHLTMASTISGAQWNEGDVSCSALRRVTIPAAFFASNGLLHTVAEVLDELVVNTEAIAKELHDHLPVLATTRLLSAVVAAGLGREEAHRLLAEPTRQAAEAARIGAGVDINELCKRLQADARTTPAASTLQTLSSDPVKLTGVAVEQTRRVVAAAREVMAANPSAASQVAEVRL